MIMYSDKDKNGNISIMELSQNEAKDLGSILFEFEFLINKYSSISTREAARLAMASAKLRFQIVGALR